jgi:WD40 repeat protein
MDANCSFMHLGTSRFSHDGLLLATASDDCTLRVWNPNTSNRVKVG